MIEAKFSLGEFKTIVTCLRGYRIPGSEVLADKIVDALKKKNYV